MNSNNKVLLVVNPISGGFGKELLIEQVKLEAAKHQFTVTTFETTGTEDEAQINALLQSQNIQKLIVAGGDGTIQMIAQAIADKDISVGIIPAGSANGLASNLNLPVTIEEQVAIALGAHYMMMDVIDVNGHACLHIADIGINAALVKNYENSDLRGKLGYALQTIPTLIESELPYHFNIDINGKKMVKEGIMIALANANQFGSGAVINPTGKMDDGMFEVLLFKKMSIIDILKTLNENSDRHIEFVECFSTTKVTIHIEKAISLQVDGEYIGEVNIVEAELCPFKIKIMIPQSKA